MQAMVQHNPQQFAQLTRLQAVREARGLTRNALARLSGISPMTIKFKEERGRGNYQGGYATERVTRSLAKALDVKLEDIADIHPEWASHRREQQTKKLAQMKERRASLIARHEKIGAEIAALDREIAEDRVESKTAATTRRGG